MNSEKKFRTKTGYCHILPDKIVLTKDENPGNLAEVAVGNTIIRILIIYGIISAGLIFLAVNSYNKQEIFSAIFFGGIALFLIYVILKSLNNSTTPVINRQSVQKIKFIKGITGLTRTRFEVYFTDNNGKTKKRMILLPGSLTGGQTETDIAYNIMTEEKLLEK